jgi:hypothetical protein
VVWKRFVVVDVLWAFKCFGTYSYGVVFMHIEVLAISGSCSQIVIISTNFVLFCWVWCFITWVLWVRLCDFSVIVVFLCMSISMAFMFSLRYSYSYIAAYVLTLQLLLHYDSFTAWIHLFSLCKISKWF